MRAKSAAGRTSTGACSTPAWPPTRANCSRPGDKAETDNYFNPQNDADLAIRQKFSPHVTPERAAEILRQLDAMDYGQFDSLAAAIEYGHQIGLKIHAWATINEDDHGWGWRSEFAKAHPEFRWVRRDGKAVPLAAQLRVPRSPRVQARAHRRAAHELRPRRPVPRLDSHRRRPRQPANRCRTASPTAATKQPNIAAFKSKYGVDPHEVPNDDDRWVRLRAEPQTLFMRDRSRARCKKHPQANPDRRDGRPSRGTIADCMDPIDGNLRGLLLDVATWAEEGLMDAAIAAGYYRAGGDADESVPSARRRNARAKSTSGTTPGCRKRRTNSRANSTPPTTLGAKRMLFWEADYIDDRPKAAALKQSMSAHAL